MAIPEDTLKKISIRNAKIVVSFKKFGMNTEELSEKFKLTQRRIQQILAENHGFVKRDKEWEKEKRIHRLEQWLKDSKNKDTRKDPLEVQAELRKEIEGDGNDSSTKGETKIIIIRPSDTPVHLNGNGHLNGIKDRAEVISRSLSI